MWFKIRMALIAFGVALGIWNGIDPTPNPAIEQYFGENGASSFILITIFVVSLALPFLTTFICRLMVGSPLPSPPSFTSSLFQLDDDLHVLHLIGWVGIFWGIAEFITSGIARGFARNNLSLSMALCPMLMGIGMILSIALSVRLLYSRK